MRTKSLAIPSQVLPLTKELVAYAMKIDALAYLFCDEIDVAGQLALRLRTEEFVAAAAEHQYDLSAFTLMEVAALIGTADPPMLAFECAVRGGVVVGMDELAQLGDALGDMCRVSARTPVRDDFGVKFHHMFELLSSLDYSEMHGVTLNVASEVSMIVIAHELMAWCPFMPALHFESNNHYTFTPRDAARLHRMVDKMNVHSVLFTKMGITNDVMLAVPIKGMESCVYFYECSMDDQCMETLFRRRNAFDAAERCSVYIAARETDRPWLYTIARRYGATTERPDLRSAAQATIGARFE